MIFPSPGWRHPLRCFWVACWNLIEVGRMAWLPAPIPPWLFGKAIGTRGRRVR